MRAQLQFIVLMAMVLNLYDTNADEGIWPMSPVSNEVIYCDRYIVIYPTVMVIGTCL